MVNALGQARRSGRSVSWRILRSPTFGPWASGLSHRIAAAPRWSPLHLLAALRSSLRGEVDAARLLAILDALDGARISYWLAGGWGIDALVGRQTRRHDDADLIIDDFDQRAPAACTVLSTIGFELIECHRQPVWMPDQWVLEDVEGARIDLVSLSWGLVRAASPDDPSGGRVFAVGTVAGRQVPCLSIDTQRLFHSGFPLRHVHRRDLDALA